MYTVNNQGDSVKVIRHVLACFAFMCFLVPMSVSAQDAEASVCGCPEGQRTCIGNCCKVGEICCGRAKGCQKSCNEPATAKPSGAEGTDKPKDEPKKKGKRSRSTDVVIPK
jgi:hypothetical protein